jgi:general secretion pathway protein D
MIADVDAAWRPVYAPNAAQLAETEAETIKKKAGEGVELTEEQMIEARMKAMRLPTISFKPPATIIDAIDFFRAASKDYDRPDIPIEKRGFNFVLKTPQGAIKNQPAESEDTGDDFAAANDGNDNANASSNGLPPIQTITASDISFYEALKLVCDSVDYKFIVRGPVVMVMHKDMSTAELLSRKYDVLDAFLERMTSASSDMKEMRSAGFGGNNARQKDNEGEENQEKDWKAFFEQMGVKWPEGSSIMYIKTLGKLYVRNTRENLAEFEKVLEEMGSQPKLIEIETRFVEVSQEDLNSLGFEWILNSNYALDFGNGLDKVLGTKKGGYTDGWVNEYNKVMVPNAGGMGYTEKEVATPRRDGSKIWSRNDMYGNRLNQGKIGIDGFGGTTDYSNGNRYLSTVGNHVSGQSASHNDQFMRVNAFLGSADLSMILHMLAQRSDTDLLSAPKVVTKSGENAVIKVVTEYIYPQDYDVQLQSSSSSSGGSSSGRSNSAVLAIVEPQNFTMREVGVILDVTPTYSEANGGTIDLELKPQVVDEPTWKNYGMKIPFTGNSSLESFEGIGSIFEGLASALDAIQAPLSNADKNSMAMSASDAANSALANLSKSSADTMTYYDAPMEQPFFHVRSIDSKVSITPGSTVVMGGLITEARKAMDDKVPFLGDIPYIGRFFRSHSEWTSKRNLLIFVTGRLITPSGRELRTENPDINPADVTPAPKAE